MATNPLAGFTVFGSKESRAAKEPLRVTVARTGAINLSRQAYEALGSPDYVQLLHNPRRRAFALRPVTAAEADARKVFRLPHGGATIHARVFTRFCGLEDGRMHRFEQPALEHGSLVVPLAGNER